MLGMHKRMKYLMGTGFLALSPDVFWLFTMELGGDVQISTHKPELLVPYTWML